MLARKGTCSDWLSRGKCDAKDCPWERPEQCRGKLAAPAGGGARQGGKFCMEIARTGKCADEKRTATRKNACSFYQRG